MKRAGSKISLGQDNNALVLLFAVNMILFVAFSFIKIIYYLTDEPMELFYRQILNWFTLPASAAGFVTRPWTILSYMFTHNGAWQVITNMLWLWCFGYILQDLAGNSKLIPVYLYGGFAGGVVFLLVNNLVPVFERNLGAAEPALGAGAAVMAVAVATTMLAPDYRIFPLINGGIPLWVLTAIFVVIDFATLSGSGGSVGAAHLAGALTGFIYIRQLRRGSDWGAWMLRFVHWVDDLFSPEKKHQQSPQKGRLFYQANRKPYEKKANVTQQRLDSILDKINQQGYEFLSDDDKEFLKRASQEEL